VRVRRDEGVAIRVGPEPCAGIREGVGEASAGECAGQPLSRVSDFLRGADTVTFVEGNTDGHVTASVCLTPRGLRPWHVRMLLAREPGDLQLDHLPCNGMVRIGKARSRSR
jgi:hypothetical protein